ncbi:MAG TPA: hypothetical protein VGA40_04150 [Candidatus Acidoferrales bacterium]
MRSLEDIGRAVDLEIERLREFLDSEVRPTAEKRMAQALRAASKKLGELAAEIEPPGPEPPPENRT